MKINCNYFKERRYAKDLARMKRAMEWHDVFLWLPVKMPDGMCRWLETVQNRFVHPDYREGEEERVREFRLWRGYASNNEWRLRR